MTDLASRSSGALRIGALLDPLRSTATFAVVLLVPLAFVLGLVALLGHFKFESSLTALAERRITLIADRARSSIEAAMRLGLRLEDIEAVQTVIDEAVARDARIEGIYVFVTDAARNVFASDPAAVAANTDPAWLRAQAASRNGAWRIQSGHHAVVGHRLDSSIARDVGGIAVAYSLADVVGRIGIMRGRLIAAATAVFVVFAGIAFAAAILVTRRFRRTVRALVEALGPARASSPGAPKPLPDSLGASVAAFRQAAGEAHGLLDAFEATLSAPADAGQPKRATPA